MRAGWASSWRRRSAFRRALGRRWRTPCRKTSDQAATFGLLSLLIVLVSATSFSRALTRMYAKAWSVPSPGLVAAAGAGSPRRRDRGLAPCFSERCSGPVADSDAGDGGRAAAHLPGQLRPVDVGAVGPAGSEDLVDRCWPPAGCSWAWSRWRASSRAGSTCRTHSSTPRRSSATSALPSPTSAGSLPSRSPSSWPPSSGSCSLESLGRCPGSWRVARADPGLRQHHLNRCHPERVMLPKPTGVSLSPSSSSQTRRPGREPGQGAGQCDRRRTRSTSRARSVLACWPGSRAPPVWRSAPRPSCSLREIDQESLHELVARLGALGIELLEVRQAADGGSSRASGQS